MRVLIATLILEVEHVLAVCLPVAKRNTISVVAGYDPVVVSVHTPDPDILEALVGGTIGDPLSVR
jgi:hypothetical protein